MNWADCSRAKEEIFDQSRFTWPVDGWAGFNCDDGTTLSDITGGIAWIWTYPGDALLRVRPINNFLELSPNHTGGYLSALIMLALVWATLSGLAQEIGKKRK